MDRWLKEPFGKRANEVLTATREGTQEVIDVSEDEEEDEDEDEELQKALAASLLEQQAGAGAGAGAVEREACAVGDDLEAALRLSKDPEQQVSEEMRHLLEAVEESKRNAARAEEEAVLSAQESSLVEMAKDRSLRMAALSDMMEPVRQGQLLRRLPGQTRPVVIDGNNVGFEHGNHQRFSPRGIVICIQWFVNRGHAVDDITAYCRPNPNLAGKDKKDFDQLVKNKLLRLIPGRHYDDL